MTYHLKCQDAAFVQINQDFFVLRGNGIFPLLLKFVVLAFTFRRIADVRELFLSKRTSNCKVEELGSIVKRRDKGNSYAFFLRVRASNTIETEQLRSLKSGNDLVNFSIAFIVYVQHNL